jgi:hypothetical protein
LVNFFWHFKICFLGRGSICTREPNWISSLVYYFRSLKHLIFFKRGSKCFTKKMCKVINMYMYILNMVEYTKIKY